MSATIARVRAVLGVVLHPLRLLAVVGGILGAIAYVWIAAVRAVPSCPAKEKLPRAAPGATRERTRP